MAFDFIGYLKKLAMLAALFIGLSAFVIGMALVFSPKRAHAEVRYHEYHGTTYGSDGSQSRVYNGDTYIKDRSGHETRCHTFASRTTCR